MITASTSGDSTTSRQSPTTRPIPNSDATSAAFARSLDHSSASSTSSMAASRGRCLARATPPAPISPILTLSNVTSCLHVAFESSPCAILYPSFRRTPESSPRSLRTSRHDDGDQYHCLDAAGATWHGGL